MPAKRKADTMASRLKRIETWQGKHEKECLKVYKRIEEAVSVLPAMKIQMDGQDVTLGKQNELLDVIRNGKGAIKITGKVVAIGIAGISAVQGIVAAGQWIISHWQ